MTEAFRVHSFAAAARQHRSSARSGPVLVTRVHPRVWATAIELANGDTSRIRVISPTTVVVRNNNRR